MAHPPKNPDKHWSHVPQTENNMLHGHGMTVGKPGRGVTQPSSKVAPTATPMVQGEADTGPDSELPGH